MCNSMSCIAIYLKNVQCHAVVSAYEAVQKRTFFPMSILIGLHLPFLILIIVLYRKLGPETYSGYSRIESLKKCDHESAEDEKELLHDR